MAIKKISRGIDSYDHQDKDRLNNPQVGLVTSDTDTGSDNKLYYHDPHIDQVNPNTLLSRFRQFHFTFTKGLTHGR